MQTAAQKPHQPKEDLTSVLRYLLRVLAFGSLLTVLLVYWIVSAENRVVWELTDFSFFPTVLFALFFLVLANLGLRRVRPRWAFTDQELATVYVMVSIATAMAGHDVIRQLVPLIGNPFWFATPENEWAELFHHYLPSWLTVSDLDVLRGYYQGGDSFWQPKVVRAWAIPFVAWSAFVIAALVVMLCLNIVLRKQWIQYEKLNYPIAQMPIEVIGRPGNFYGNPLMWAGFGLAFLLEIAAGLHYLYPAFPFVPMKYNLTPFFREKPWNAASTVAIYVYPFATGLGYLMPLDLSFSLWFFYLFGKLQLVSFAAIGWPTGSAWMGEFRGGAWLSIALVALWTSRRHIGRVLAAALGMDRSAQAERDPVYRWALVGLVLGSLFIFLFWLAAGMSWWMVLLYFGLYFLLVIAMTRMRAELGPPTHELHDMHPDRILVTFLGTRPFGAQNLTLTRLNSWLAYGYRCHPAPHQMEGFKIGSVLNVRDGRLIGAMLLAGAVGTVVSIGAHIVLYYQYRFAQWGVGEFNVLASWISNPRGPDLINIYRILAGFSFATFLAAMKRRFLWWPFYPVGYAVGGGWAIGVDVVFDLSGLGN
ncbi:MAG: hypothetical protein KatS3mg115_1161 [Candidatus Poribacteria bacterium]|nr:MAG: hypothetical protein KatS3mg115_1161 [Candidatus Poribacteria bacterium]